MMVCRGVMAGLVAAFCMSSAEACRGPMFEQSVIFRDVTGIDAPVVLRVTVTEMIRNEQPAPGTHVPWDQYVERFTLVGLAQVEQVIKGEFSDPFVRVAVLPTSCGPGLTAGLSGIVAGSLQRDAQGRPVLRLLSESDYGREKRLRKAGKT